MATIAIKDLPESVDLDRQAMLAITGGARSGGRPERLGRTAFRGTRSSDRIVDYPSGFAAPIKSPAFPPGGDA